MPSPSVSERSGFRPRRRSSLLERPSPSLSFAVGPQPSSPAIWQTADFMPRAAASPAPDVMIAATIAATSSSTPRYSALVCPRCERIIVAGA